MTSNPPTPPERDEAHASADSDGGVTDALRAAVERTMRATTGPASSAAELVDEVVRRGREARSEVVRRGQEAGAGLARRGQEATGEVGRRVELLERRLAELERRLGTEARPDVEPQTGTKPKPQSEAEG
jgi:hypothetical protein